ncbi:MAG: glycoside hydrolase family 1 protein [Actinomycetales bacterium]|nr:glycoside hydrolase family 1 protein [Candidatus Phosphoribacter baldrii]MBK6953989.1 glycoside hydrolase family 1 protein [Candidatus Phosphoribacter baldrii]
MTECRLDGVLLGVATAATQIEGGCDTTNWADWAKTPGHIADGTTPVRATGHWERWREDTELMASLGIQTYRFGVEWARLEPQPGVFSDEAFAHYRDEITLLRDKGIRPLLTLHHFNNPRWFESMGAFEHPDCVPIFLRFVERVVTELGDLVEDWCTINEPNVYATFGYLYGVFPPGAKSLPRTLRVMTNLAHAHITAYELIHALRAGKPTRVTFAVHLRVFDPANPANPVHRALARAQEFLFQEAVTEAMCTGRFRMPLRRPAGIREGRYYDALGINYYSRSWVSKIGDAARPGAELNDLGWEIYPEGLERVARWAHDRWPAPIWVTENGTADNTERFRTQFLHDHLEIVSAARATGLPFERFYHWCFVDNWEWAEGEVPRFGIVALDYATQERTVKPSGRFYADVIAAGGVTAEIAARHLSS